ncbi:MAG: hypothetical protein MR467_03160 [Bacillales bacterium]|nr:hypothetical protein [Bacillales bacterium]MDY3904528.1 hypothetical protein [Candidatus Enteromonas sp.]
MIRVKRLLGILIPVVASFTIVGTGFSAFYFGNGLNKKDADVSANVQKKVPSSFGGFEVKFVLDGTEVSSPSFLIWQNEVEGVEAINLTYTFDTSKEKEGDYSFSDFTYQIHYKLSINESLKDGGNPYFQFNDPMDTEGLVCESLILDNSADPQPIVYDYPETTKEIKASIPLAIVYRPGMVPSSREDYKKLSNMVHALNDSDSPFITYEFSLVPTLKGGIK